MNEHRQVLRKCLKCDARSWLAREVEKCPKCEALFFEEEERGKPHHVRFDWKPWISENLDHHPVYIKSRQHWRHEMQKRGLRCKAYES